jgi:uncharacterized protein (DUF1330 family)
MPAYLIASVTVTDPEKYAGYMALTPGAIAAYGGRFVVRGGAHEVVEGRWPGSRNVVIEFPDLATAKRFFASPEYASAREQRQGAADFNAIVVDGV